MCKRIFSSLVCSTALMTFLSANAVADDIYMVQLSRPKVERIVEDPSLAAELPVLGETTGSVKEQSFVRPQALPGRHPKRLHIVGTTVNTAQDSDSDVPLKIIAVPEDKPDATVTDAPKAAASAPIATPAVPQPTPVEVPAAATPQARPVEASTAPAPGVTPAPAPVTAETPARTDPTPAVAAAPVVVPPAVAATPAPAAQASASPKGEPVTTAATPPTKLTPPVQAHPEPAVASAPVATPVAPMTPAVAPPAVATAPIEPPKAPLAADLLTLSLKSTLEARFTAKPADDKKVSAEERKSRAGIVAFYAARNYEPIWVDPAGLTARATAAIDRLAHAGEDGLNPRDYPVPTIGGDLTADTLAKAEVILTEATMKYARQAEAGRFDPNRLGDEVTPKVTIPDPDAVLKVLSASADVSGALQAFNPPQDGYRRLRAKLAELEQGKPLEPQARVPAGPTIRPGEKDTRVALLRNRLGVTGTTTADDASVYDDSLVDAVKSFQKKNGLKPSGLIGPQTVDAVNETAPGAEARASDIVANMERWRWLPRDLGQLHVMVNIPDFALSVVRDGVVTHRTKAIVGRVANPTPVFSDTMTHIIVNPYWNVPYSIVKKEYLAKAQETGGEALNRGNFEVEVGNQTVDPTTVDWSTVNASQVHLRQRPGEGNALGNIKFMFPNQHSVYIHDTSSRGLFVQSYRSLSHGCVRVQDPFSFADALLAEEPTAINGSKLKAMIGGGEKYLWLKKTIPVHIAYFTDFVDDAGVLQTRPDLYGINGKTKQLLGL